MPLIRPRLVTCVLLAACSEPSAPADPDGPSHDLLFEGVLGAVPEMLVRDAETGAVVRVLPTGTVAMDPQPSPDGTRILFVVADYESATGDVFVVDRDGSDLRRLTDAPELDDQPAWSPDGTRIAFRSFRTGRDGDIWVMDDDGSGATLLTPDPLPGVTDEAHPTWSPDGARIAFVSNAGGNVDLWTMASDGSDHVRLTATEDFDTEPAWSPTGATLAFRRSAPDAGSDVWVVPAGGGEATAIRLPGEQRMPAWVPGGQRLAFVSQANAAQRPDIIEAGVDGTDLRGLVTSEVPGGSTNPAFLRRR